MTISNRWRQGEMAVGGQAGRPVSGEAGEQLPFMGNGESDCHKRAMGILPIKGKPIAFKGRPNPSGNLGARRVEWGIIPAQMESSALELETTLRLETNQLYITSFLRRILWFGFPPLQHLHRNLPDICFTPRLTHLPVTLYICPDC